MKKLDAVHSTTPKKTPVIWEFALKRLSDSGTDYNSYFQSAFLQNKAFSSLNLKDTERILSMLQNLKAIYTKLKNALIYTRYSLRYDDIKGIGNIIKKLDEYTSLLKSNTKTDSHRHIGPDKLYCQKHTGILYGKYLKIKSIAQDYIDTTPGRMIFTDNSWPEKTVLIGSLRNSKQLQIALDREFYHAPKAIVQDPLKIKCIAIYQSKNLFEKSAGVKYYGKVLTYYELPRYEIKEIPSDSKEIYYRFEIEKWKILKNTIEADALGEVATRTTLYQLLIADKTSELHLDTKDEFELYEFMKSSAFLPYPAYFNLGEGVVVYSGEIFEVYRKNTLKMKFTSEDFYKSGVVRAKTVSALLQTRP